MGSCDPRRTGTSVITADNDLVEQIVANVLAELRPQPTVRAESVSLAPPSPPPKVESTSAIFDQPVITAELLNEYVRGGQVVRIGPRSILTPSARDWLSQRKIDWSRINSATVANPGTAARWQLVITSVTPAVSTLRPTLSAWKSELLGTPEEAADLAVRSICTGDADGVLGFCNSAATVACLANRNPRVRAAVLHSTEELSELTARLDPNLLVVNPQRKSFVELRNLVRAVGALQKPRDRHPWASGS